MIQKLGTSFRDFERDRDWDYTRVAGPLAEKFIKFEDQGGGLYELVVLDLSV